MTQEEIIAIAEHLAEKSTPEQIRALRQALESVQNHLLCERRQTYSGEGFDIKSGLSSALKFALGF